MSCYTNFAHKKYVLISFSSQYGCEFTQENKTITNKSQRKHYTYVHTDNADIITLIILIVAVIFIVLLQGVPQHPGIACAYRASLFLIISTTLIIK